MSTSLSTLAAALSPALLFKKRLGWFSALCARAEFHSTHCAYGMGISVDSGDLGLAQVRVGPGSEENQRIVESMRSGGLSDAQAREAVIAHELGHLAYAGLMHDESKRWRAGEIAQANGIGRGVLEAKAACARKLSPLARYALMGAPMAGLVIGSLAIGPVTGLACVALASWASEQILKKDRPGPPMQSAVVFEEGFCDAFAALLPLAGPQPDFELARARARSFHSLREGLLFGASHAVMKASDVVLQELESPEARSGEWSLERVMDMAAAAATAPLGMAWAVSRFDELEGLMVDRDAFREQASAHELQDSEPSLYRHRQLRDMLAKGKAEEAGGGDAPGRSAGPRP